LFSIVGDINISQGSVVTYMRCGGICSDSISTNVLLILTLKNFWKWVNIEWSYKAYKVCQIFWATMYASQLLVQ